MNKGSEKVLNDKPVVIIRKKAGPGVRHLGMIGFEGRVDYGAVGPVTNIASRLCDEARGGQILITQRVLVAVDALVESELVWQLALKGLFRPVSTFNVVRWREPG